VRSTAELYDWELRHLHHRIDQDVPFYRGLARALAGPVLELGCGTGRVSAPLVKAGVDVVGLDISPDMLRLARDRGVAKTVQADMRRFAFAPDAFALVAIPYNSLQLLLDDDAIVDCLQAAAASLQPHGLIAFEATDFPAEDDVDDELLAEADGMRLIGSLRVDGDILHYHRRFEENGVAHTDTISLRRGGASNAERWVSAAGLQTVSADWVGLSLRVTARLHD
jgi:SAM-dependent methyltransferase